MNIDPGDPFDENVKVALAICVMIAFFLGLFLGYAFGTSMALVKGS